MQVPGRCRPWHYAPVFQGREPSGGTFRCPANEQSERNYLSSARRLRHECNHRAPETYQTTIVTMSRPHVPGETLYYRAEIIYVSPEHIQSKLRECATSPSETCESLVSNIYTVDGSGWFLYVECDVFIIVQGRKDVP